VDVDALDLSEVLAFSSWVNAMLEVGAGDASIKCPLWAMLHTGSLSFCVLVVFFPLPPPSHSHVHPPPVPSPCGVVHSSGFSPRSPPSPTQYGSTGLGGGFLPLDLDAEIPMIVEAMRSGVVLCQLVNAVTPHTVDERVRDPALPRVHGARWPGVVTCGLAGPFAGCRW
jgi:hypothetical protein